MRVLVDSDQGRRDGGAGWPRVHRLDQESQPVIDAGTGRTDINGPGRQVTALCVLAYAVAAPDVGVWDAAVTASEPSRSSERAAWEPGSA